jgi:hypothetical protein
MKRTITIESVTEGLRTLIEEFETGRRPIPLRGVGPRRSAGVPIIPIVVHDALCGWRIDSEKDDEPGVLACDGCGLAFLQSEMFKRRA